MVKCRVDDTQVKGLVKSYDGVCDILKILSLYGSEKGCTGSQKRSLL